MVDKVRRQGFSFDRPVVFLVMLIVSAGLVMVSSASFPLDDDPYHYFVRQLMFVGIGLALMVFIGARDIRRLDSRWLVRVLVVVSLVLLGLCFVPGVGLEINHARRWIRIGPIQGQPSEIAKGVALLFFAYYLAHRGDEVRSLWRGVLPVTAVALAFAGAIVVEPDLGGASMIVLVMMVMLFLAGARLRVLGAFSLLGAAAFTAVMWSNPYQRARFFTFLHPWDDPTGASYQIKNSLIAFGRGHVTGVGVGNGLQKLFYLPEINSDFIFANLAEELGLIGLWFVLILFGLLVFRAMRLAMRSREPFVRLIGAGAAALLGLQVVVNAGVVMCLLPTKGLAFPFMSYGGSSAILNFSLVGLILAVGRASAPRAAHEPAPPWSPWQKTGPSGPEDSCSDARNTSTSWGSAESE
jgi:cell division protein FtsW